MKSWCALLLIFVLCGCIAKVPLPSEPRKEKIPESVSQPLPLRIPKETPRERYPFEALSGKYRMKAAEFEDREDWNKALFSWKVVQRLDPGDNESAGRIKHLEARIRADSERHFLQGLEYYRKNLLNAARKEFLMALAYDPEHKQALEYVKHKLNEKDLISYETKGNDTPSRIAREVYRASDRDFLVAYFNDLNVGDSLKPGLILKLPNMESAPVAKPSYPEDRLSEAKALLRSKKYEQAIAVVEKILEADPWNTDANDVRNASYYELGALFLQKKEYRDSLRRFKKVDISYKDVSQRISSLEKNLQDQQSQAKDHYTRGIRFFLAESLDEAIKEWEETLRLDPGHAEAKKDLEKARRVRENFKKLQ